MSRLLVAQEFKLTTFEFSKKLQTGLHESAVRFLTQ